MTSDPDFATVPELIEELRAGRMIIVVDDENRENEGDFVVAAELVTAENIVQMNRLASGIITVPMPRPWLRRLHIDPMVQENAESMHTAFTITVDAAHGISTGSSAHDRAKTIRRLADPGSSAADFVRPGHVGPLLVRPGGVLRRSGHTEASHDLMRLAGLQPVAVLCEIMDDDGEMMRLPALRTLAKRMGLKLGTIEDLIRHRRRTETLVERIATEDLTTQLGNFTVHRYRSTVDAGRYTALVSGTIDPAEPVLVRMHAATLTGDLLGLLGGAPDSPLQIGLSRVAEQGGILLYIEREAGGSMASSSGAKRAGGSMASSSGAKRAGGSMASSSGAKRAGGSMASSSGAKRAGGSMASSSGPMDDRDYGIGAQVLVDLGARRLRLMTDNPKRRAALHGFDLEVVENVPLRRNVRLAGC